MRALILLTFTLLSFALPMAAQDADTAQPSGTIAVQDSAEIDAAIAVRIRDILAELEGYDDVTVTVSSGIVTLKGTTIESDQQIRLTELVRRVQDVVAIENQVTASTDVIERLDPAMDRFMSRLEQLFALLPLLLVASVAFALVVFIGFFIARMRQPWDRLAPNEFIANIYRQVLRIGFVIAGIVIALDILDATALLSTILGAAGIIGLAIGFAVRDTVENFIASIMLSIRQPFRPNDTVEINGDEGRVIRLTSRATILLSFDGNHIRIPNATVFKSRIVNYSRNTQRRFLFKLDLHPDADLALARDTALAVLADLPYTLSSPDVNVWIDDAKETMVTLTCVGWIDQTKTSLVMAKGEAIRTVRIAFGAADISLSTPSTHVINSDKPAPKKRRKPGAESVIVDTKEDTALEELVDQERNDPATNDLLRDGALEE